MSDEISRDPPAAVKKILRQETGFGCAVPACPSPYLQYHHFDPPWRVEHHQDPDRMIALCTEHHDKADRGAYTVEQCRKMKADAAENRENAEVTGRFDWMRRDILTVAGNNYYYETPEVLSAGGEPLLWFNRDDENHMLLNLRTPDVDGNERVSLTDNDWTIRGDPLDVISPSGGAELHIRYADGDTFDIWFRDASTFDDLSKWPGLQGSISTLPEPYSSLVHFPLTVLEVRVLLRRFQLHLTETRCTVGDRNRAVFQRCFFGWSNSGLSI